MTDNTSFDEVVNFLNVMHWTRYSVLAPAIIIVYDYLITIKEEISLVWNSRWTLGKVMFLMLRYYVLFTAAFDVSMVFNPRVTDKLCNNWAIWEFFTGAFVFCLAEGILCLRLYAMYLCSRKILVFLSICFFTTIFSMCGIFFAYFDHSDCYTAVLLPEIPIHFCFLHRQLNKHFYAFWIPLICFDTILLTLALYRGYDSFMGLVRSGFSRRHMGLLDILVQNSVLYYLVVFTGYFVAFMVWKTRPPDQIQLPIGFSLALSAIMSQRLLLDVRRRAMFGETTTAQTLSTIFDFRFGSGLNLQGAENPAAQMQLSTPPIVNVFFKFQ